MVSKCSICDKDLTIGESVGKIVTVKLLKDDNTGTEIEYMNVPRLCDKAVFVHMECLKSNEPKIEINNILCPANENIQRTNVLGFLGEINA